jgi:stage V sporulation protein R
MTRAWDLKDLEQWDRRIRAKAEEFGLTCFPQEFEVCDHEQMLGYMAYHGMPSHYPHWSYGKSYEKLKTLYDHGVSGLPYEMVINANPSLAYLMRANSLCLQILTIAHVYGHNDFFHNNFMFRNTRPELTVGNFKLRADRIRGYVENSTIGLAAVESILDAAHALSMQTQRHDAIRKLSRTEQQSRAQEAAQPPHDPYEAIHKPRPAQRPDLGRLPLEPEDDLLAFIAEHNPYLAEWERDLLHIVREESHYFLPQIETKIMNEGWASFWHHRIMNSLELPDDLHLEFLVHHNQVIRPHPGDINPYHLGFTVWHDILRRYDEPTADEIARHGAPEKSGMQKLFEVRETDRDVSFLRRFLTEDLMRRLDMFEYQREDKEYVVSKVSDEENWEAVKTRLLQGVGMGTVPVIRIIDADHGHNREMLLEHEHDGRDLHLEYLEKTLAHVHRLWGRKVLLRTVLSAKPVMLTYDTTGFNHAEL